MSVEVSVDMESSRARWRAAVAAVLAKSTRRDPADLPDEPERLLDSPTYEGFPIRPIYTALDALPAGGWQGPVASPFGLHLVWIEERTAAHVPPFDELRGRALHAYLREKGAARAKSRIAVLRCREAGDAACAG